MPGSGDDLVAQVLFELNWARTEPVAVVTALKGRLSNYKGKDYHPPERGGSCVVTKEGKVAVQDAISYLEGLQPMGSLGKVVSQGLNCAAEDHAADIGFTGAVAHDSSDGTSAAERALRYGGFDCFGECLWYGSALSDARGMVLDLIVDDGVASRGHRLNIYNPRYDTVGIGNGPHATYGRITTMEFAQGWRPNQDAINARIKSGPIQVSGQDAAKKNVSTQWKSLGDCAVCEEQIKGGAVMEVKELGGKMHKDCFKCMNCSKALAGQPFNVQNRKPYCQACHAELYGERCAGCSLPITGGMIKCCLGVFHEKCVKCSQCDAEIGRKPFSTEGKVITCQSCQADSIAGLCAGAASGSASRSSVTSKAPADPKAKAKASAKAKGKAQPKAKAGGMVSLAKAGATVVGLGGDYGNL